MRDSIRAVAYPREGIWIVQGIEYDITTRAANAHDAPTAFAQLIRETIALANHLGKQPFAGIKPAPDRFEYMFNSGSPTPPDAKTGMTDKGEVEVRLALD
jgi:hypothetical protein